MKRYLKFLISAVLILTVLVSAFVFSAAADGTASVNTDKATYNVGDTVTVTVNIDAGEEMASLQSYVKYNKSVLSFQNQGLITAEGDNVKIVATPGGAKTYSATFNFTAIAAGSAEIELFDVKYVYLMDTDLNGAMKDIDANKKTITVTAPTPPPADTPDTPVTPPADTPDTPVTPPPADTPPASDKSSNANLASLTLGSGTIEPEFKSDVTAYNVTVRFQVEKLTISANAEDGKSVVEGIGTFDLEVGETKKYITVTAEDGTKKVYELTIKRLTSEETELLPPEEPPVELGPLDIEFYGSYLRVVQDTSNLPVPHGFTAATASHNDIEVGVMMDNVKGEYILYYLTDLSGNNGDYYYKDEKGNFQRLNYISVNGRLYIVEQSFGNYTAPDGWEDCEYNLHTGKVKAFRAGSDKMEGFYMFFCYVNGERGFYRYDSLQNTIQREPEFVLVPLKDQESKAQAASIFERFAAMNFAGKAVVILLVAAVLFIIAIVALMIVKFVKMSGQPIEEEEAVSEEEYLPVSDGADEFTTGEEFPTEENN